MKKENSMQSANRVVLLINWILDLFLILGYIVEYFKGGKTLSFVAAFCAIVIVPMTIATTIYFKDKNNSKIKIITLTGYLIVYALGMFASTRTLVYVYVFPIISMYLLYFNFNLIITSCSIIFAMNIIRIIWLVFVMGLNNSEMTTDYTIQLASVFLYSLALIVSTKLSNKFSEEKMESINEERGKQEAILQDVIKITAALDSNSKRVYEINDELAVSANAVSHAVTEITQGTLNTTKSIQDQSELTHNIHSIIEDASGLSVAMRQLSNETTQVVHIGLGVVSNLSERAAVVNENSENAYNLMQELKEKSNQIQRITDIITGISEQTGLLSLNASIESARAGEAGRGFAVVAEEIRKLAEQSKQSSNDIFRIISELIGKSESSVEAVVKLRDINNEQSKLIIQSKQIFDNISSKISEVNENVGLVNVRINEILDSNNKIIESISEISAVSEQTTANAQQANAMAMQNYDQSSTAKKLVEELIETSREIAKYTVSAKS